MGQLNGSVTAAKSLGHLSIYAFNNDKHVGYLVYVVRGRYRATNLFPGHYDVTLRGTVGQSNWGLPQRTVQVDVSAGKATTENFKITETTYEPTYVGGMTYPNVKVEPYGTIYPAGAGRDIIERTCFGCHTAQFFPYNALRTFPTGRAKKDKETWVVTVDRMSRGVAFNAKGKPSYFDGALLSPSDRDVLVDYLTTNFGPDSKLRAVQQESDPQLDDAVLAKMEIVEYRFLNKPGEDDRFTHTPDFDGNGNVWIMDRGAASLVKVDPRTAEVMDHQGHGGGEYLTVDTDGTIWYGGLSHYDPKTNQHDEYKFEGGKNGRYIPVSTLMIDTTGDIWLSLLTSGGLAKFDRKTNSVVWWDVPSLRSRPYGITLDHEDRVWIAEYHTSGLERFDPRTHDFRHYPLTVEAPTNIRRPAVDAKNYVWASTWGSLALQNAALYRLDQNTGQVVAHKVGIPYANPYDAEVDKWDNVWVATDNFILKFDQKTNSWTRYPVAVRTDIPKMAVTREGNIWFGERNAGQSGGYGGVAAALYPDKDKIESFAAYYDKNNARDRKAQYLGASTPVTGTTKLVPAAPQNPGEYERALGLACACKSDGSPDNNAPAALKGGAAVE
jgi:virginiamycin B lyase